MNGILYMDTTIFKDETLYKKGFSLISEERKMKIDRFKNPAPARLSLGAGVLLRIALDRCGLTEKLNEIKYGEHGKPYLEDIDFHFSLSHSGEYAICAYSDVPVGIDLQKVKERLPKHTKKILSEMESAFLKDLDETEQIRMFYRLWARKESLIKWDGRGLRIPLQEISFYEGMTLIDQVEFQGKTVFFREYDRWMPEYAFALCSEKKWLSASIEEITSEILTIY